ncbi:PH domain-containing protein [Cellulomonas palmilytica]|uniref:PH domain-containing protein n=1 Tax=Cellulomonas palmilytica TaxID=2608402 RepID=UPI001F277A3A|nr:PH domain-containing protein [Cellulomonas palmilytica]UJP41214.1 PH domain-containing protein [Cellulomonas palmilytica]
MRDDDETWTFRPRSAAWITGGTWLVVAGFAGAAVAEGGAGALLRAVPFTAAAALVTWLLAYLPHVRLDDEGIHVVNPFVTHHVPWEALIEIRTRFTCTFVTPGRKVEAFAAPGPGRHAATRAASVDLRHAHATAFDPARSVSIGEIGHSPSAVVATEARRRWERLVEGGELELGVADEVPVRRELHTTGLVTVVALVALGAVLQLVG